MRHNIPTDAGLAKFIGTGLKGVVKVIIGEDEFDVEDGNLYEQYLQTLHFPTKVVLCGDERRYKLYVRIPDTYYAQTSLADLYVGKNNVSVATALRWASMINIETIFIIKAVWRILVRVNLAINFV